MLLGAYMVFKKKSELGHIDPNINQLGLLKKPKPLNNRELREREQLSLLRKLKPHLAEAIKTAVNILKCEQASDSNKLKASVIILNAYKETVNDLYQDDDNEPSSQTPLEVSPSFSYDVLEVKGNADE